MQKFAGGAKIRHIDKKTKIFPISIHILSAATFHLPEKLPLNYFKKQFGLTASRAQSGAKDGFWRVITDTTKKYRQIRPKAKK